MAAKPVLSAVRRRRENAATAPRRDLPTRRVPAARYVPGPGHHRLRGVSRADRRESAFRRFRRECTRRGRPMPGTGSPTISCTCSARLMPTLTLAAMLRIAHRTARTMLTTYLGHDAALRVLGGNIVRGRAEPIRAVVWFSDLVGFTRISDKVGRRRHARASQRLRGGAGRGDRGARRPRAEVHRRRDPRDLPRRPGRGRLRERARRRGRPAPPHRRAQRATHRGRACR